MSKRRERDRGWPPDPEPLDAPAIDNHTHLDSIHHVLGAGEPAPSTAEHLARARAVGVTRMVQVGCDLPAARWTVAAVAEHPELLGAVALHPNEAPLHAGVHEVAPDGLDPAPRSQHATGLDEALAEIAELARAPRIRAIGETGLDFFRGGERAREVQRASFRAHIALAKELGLALQIHDRDAHGDILEILEADGAPERTVFHCFSGDAEMAAHCARRGWFLSFSGTLTFRANDALRAALAVVPPALVLAETDAPYLTPHPFRGRPNAPYLLPLTIRAMAAVQGVAAAETARVTAANAEQVYGTW
ncbi:MAG: TatD family hydrolase [Cellulomonadaceae bacterium]